MPPGAGAGGGTHSYVAELLHSLPDYGWRCFAVTRRTSTSQAEVSSVRDGATIVRVPIGRVEAIDKRSLNELHTESLQSVRRIVEDLGAVDILHSVYWNSGRVARDLAREFHMRYVHTVISNGRRREIEGASPGPAERFDIESVVFQDACRIFSVATEERNDLALLYGIDPRKVLIVGRPVDACFPASRSQKRERRAFLYVGRLDPNKGIDEIIEAWLATNRSLPVEIPLWIVGGTADEITHMRRNLRRASATAAARNALQWWGRLGRPAIAKMLQQSIACVTHSRYEPGGRVVLESMSAGVPVIATPHGFALEAMRHGASGLLVDHGDISELTAEMHRLAVDWSWGDVLGAGGAQSAAHLLTKRRFLEKHCEAYELSSKSYTNERYRSHG